MENKYKPTEGMKKAAQKGLDFRDEYNRGGTAVGIARARDIVNNKSLPIETVARMYSFFKRHEVDKQAEGFRSGEDGYPSNGLIAWLLWGGDAGYSWSTKIWEKHKENNKSIIDISYLIDDKISDVEIKIALELVKEK